MVCLSRRPRPPVSICMAPGPECYGYHPATSTSQDVQDVHVVATAPLDVYWSASRKDLWSLASDASRAQAIAAGYVLVQKEVARVPTVC